MKTPEDEAFDDLARRQGAWGGGFQAKRQMAAVKLQEFCTCHETHPMECQGCRANRLAQPAQEPDCQATGVCVRSGLYAPPQPAQEPVANSFEEYCQTLHPLWNTHISRTYAEQFFMAGQAAQPAQEPVCDKDPQGCWSVRCQLGKQCKNLAQPAQEQWKCVGPPCKCNASNAKQCCYAVFTTPPQRPWVGLTDADIERIKLMTYEKETNADGEEQEAVNIDWLIKTTEHFCKEKNT